METRRGVWYAIGAYVAWGLSPIFWNLIPDLQPLELLAHRIIWAVPILAIVIGVSHRWSEVRDSYRTWRARWLTVAAAAFVLSNWGFFLWAVTNGRILEASLGYFINPLVSVALGVVVLGEHLRRLQWAAVGIAILGVIGMTIAVGELPWISLILAGSFGTYGLIKKRPETPRPVVSLFGESAVLVIPATILAIALARTGSASFGQTPGVSVFLVATGLMTVLPLLLFGAAAKRIPLSAIGLLQYIAPTLQLLVGVLIYEETLTGERLAWFVVVWIALALYSFDSYRSLQSRREPGANPLLSEKTDR
ncbi:MAG: EamA family transporter RarD [Acidimicrobiia bacterium]|nr:MAG: EamA family transporter RarD [Acidimicrobiia bacterium]